ncbi:tripartite tricarboxylate transporter substrate binding protein BugD [Cupriavidus sp. KK10]|jgi:tripartite-type tricarboxylate transporter receptor subunit TctC|uniref:tripartite tricarboxylate transporter substrate-binding protein n=1 Tax=Cupriavidus sp. KK10 TaxID=1478019 RepID=UPI001BABB3A1|nr:tripartite tricarboxylate transporter substrate-binding protein [Cupriavidus sp. KK10]QUN29955.1 tripartite tricarboxylate transporter substrate binding protein BugD [Cupriavidus sp. KK10]
MKDAKDLHAAPRWLAGVMVMASALAGTSGAAAADAYPGKPITLVVPYSAGGPTDVVARTLAQAMSQDLGQSVVVENRTGAGGTVAAAFVARAQADGYTLLIHHNGMATAPALYKKLSYAPLKDFAYVGQVADVPMTLMGRKDLPAKTVPELIRYVTQNKDKVSLANAGLGAVSQLCGVLFEQSVHVKLNAIPYQGAGPALTALLGGQVDLLCDQTTATLPHIQADRVRLFGVTTPARIKALPSAPTLQEGGLKGFDVKVWHGIYAPKGTSPAVVARLTKALQKGLQDPVVIKKLDGLGAEIVPVDKQTPEGLRTLLKAESDKWQPLLKSMQIEAD